MAAPKLSLVFLLVSLFVFVHSKPSKMESTLTSSINQFSMNFYKETAALKPGENLIMSPLSAEIVLALLSLGARGNTLNELNTAMYLPNSDFTKTAFKTAISKLNAVKGVTLHIANKVYVMQNYAISSEYKKDAVDIFASELQSLNFAMSDASASTINKWVESKTNEKIKDLISADSLNGDTRMVLVNAIYFKGDWEKKFKTEFTSKKDFHLNSKDKVQVDMMYQSSKFNYADLPDLKAQVLEMKYANSDMSMVIILPNEIEGLKDVEAKLSTFDLKKDVFDNLHEVEVMVTLPKFKIETEIDMKDVLTNLGMKTMFDPALADLSGLLQSSEQLFVSKAIQKAFIEVNEEGAEAAAASVGAVRRKRSAFMPKTFNCDHPFLFVLRSRSEMTVSMFIGRFNSLPNVQTFHHDEF